MPIYGQMIINSGLRRRTPIIYALYTVKSAVKYTLDSLTLLRRLAELIIGLFSIKVTVRGMPSLLVQCMWYRSQQICIEWGT